MSSTTESPRRGRPPIEGPARPADEVLLAALAAADGNVSRSQPALGLPMPTLRTWLLNLGVTLRGRGRPKGHSYRPELPELVEQHGGHLTPIGEALGVTAERARQLIVDAGLQERAEQLRGARKVSVAAAEEAEREKLIVVRVCDPCRRTFRSLDGRRLTCGPECARERKLTITRVRVRELYRAKKAALLAMRARLVTSGG